MLLYEEETGKIIKACINVFNELGNGFLEAVYQDAMEIEFRDMQIPYARESKICRPPLKIVIGPGFGASRSARKFPFSI